MNQNTITPFAKTSFRNTQTVFGIKTDDRRRHMYIIGKTGMGKTNLLENLVINDIRNGHGVCFIDPHGDTAEKLISMIPSSRVDEVVYFNPGDQSFPISFNILEKVDAKYRPLVASGVIGVFQKLWADSWGPRLEYILRNAILALLEYPGTTLLDVMRILVDKKYAAAVASYITDPIVKSFWVNEFTKWNERVLQEVVSPIQNKVGQFLTNPLIRNVIGQKKSSFDVREVMDSQKILIMNLAKGRIGEDNTALLGAIMITKIQLAAMSRVDILNEDDRKDFYLYVDEFQNFATESFANILSEARKYRLNLILANQYMAQLQDEVREAVFGNAGTLISFRIGAADAEVMEREFEPVFTMNDIVNIPKYNIYIKLMIDGIAGDAFSAEVLPPVEVLHEDSTQYVIDSSRRNFSMRLEDVENEIAELNKDLSPNGSDNAQNKSNRDIVSQKAQKEMFDASCHRCENSIQVPFKPDGVREVYCRECLKLHQKQVAPGIVKERKKNAEKRENDTRKMEYDKKFKKEKNKNFKKDLPRKIENNPVYSPFEKTMKLSQMKHIEPKKFNRGSNKEKKVSENTAKKISTGNSIKDMIKNLQRNAKD